MGIYRDYIKLHWGYIGTYRDYIGLYWSYIESYYFFYIFYRFFGPGRLIIVTPQRDYR